MVSIKLICVLAVAALLVASTTEGCKCCKKSIHLYHHMNNAYQTPVPCMAPATSCYTPPTTSCYSAPVLTTPSYNCDTTSSYTSYDDSHDSCCCKKKSCCC